MKVSCLSLNSILLQLRVLYINIANLQSVTLNLGHTALIPAFLDLLQCCLVTVFRWNCSSSRPTLRGKEKGGRAQHVNVIPSIDPSFNVTDCRLLGNCVCV